MIKVAINGFGRIGRLAFRLMFDNPEFDIVAINDLSDSKALAHLLKYDTAHGRFNGTVEVKEGAFSVNGKDVKVIAEKDPTKLPWKDLDVDVVLECTGIFRSKDKADMHLEAGAKKVVISAPGKGDMPSIVYNVNHDILTGDENIIDGASCTTNCLSPVAKVLNDNFGIVKGFMTTVHAFTADQNTVDGVHKDFRRARAASQNISPTTTGAAVAVGKVLPELNGKLDGMAMRVPTVTGSVVDLVVELKKEVTAEEINKAMKAASEGELKDTLGYTEDPIVSSDVIGCTNGSLFDSLLTNVMTVDGKQLVKVVSWYDNEMSYTSQLVRLVKHLASLIK